MKLTADQTVILLAMAGSGHWTNVIVKAEENMQMVFELGSMKFVVNQGELDFYFIYHVML